MAAIQYPSRPNLPAPVNPLEMGLSGLMEGWEEGRKQKLTNESNEALINAGRRSGAFGAGAPAGIGSLSALRSVLGGSAVNGAGPAPGTTTGGATPSTSLTGDSGKIYGDFISTVKAGDASLGLAGVTNPYGLAAVASTGRAESGYSPGNIHRQWSDPSESGKAGNAGGLLSWRAERLDNMRAFAAKVGDDPNRPSAATQAKFFLSEDPSLVAKLNAAQSPEEAQQLMNRAWAFAGWDRPGGEAARRTAMARSYFANEFGRSGGTAAIEAQAPRTAGAAPVEVASNDPRDGMASALAYSPAGPSAQAGAASVQLRQPVGTAQPPRVPVPTPRPEEQTYTVANAPTGGSLTAAPAMAAGSDPLLGLVQSVGIGQTHGLNFTEDEFRALMRNPDTRELGMALFQQKVTGDPRAQQRAIDLAIQLDERAYNRQRQATQDTLAADQRTYERGRDAESDRRWQIEQDRLAQGGVPTGYRRTSGGGLEAIPGGPSDPALERPNLETIYVDGREQKGYFDRNRTWVPVGDAKAPSGNSGGITIGPDGTVQIGGGGAKVPANFMPDPQNPGAVKPIPGGPGEQISAELAARLGLAKNFLDQAPDLRKRLEAGEATGPLDRAQAGNNAASDQADLYRKLQSGTDALMRMLTGAGMNETEARSYADRYLPGYFDNSTSAVRKLDQLTDELRAADREARRGRGGTPNDAPAADAKTDAKSDNDPLGLR